MKALLSILVALWLFVSILAEINYKQAINSVMLTDRSDSSICGMMEIYGFDMKGNPFAEIGYSDKLKALIN